MIGFGLFLLGGFLGVVVMSFMTASSRADRVIEEDYGMRMFNSGFMEGYEEGREEGYNEGYGVSQSS